MPPQQRRPFHVFVDEAQLFVGEAVEDLLTEARKYNCSLVLANHFMRQFDRAQADAIRQVGTTLVFNVPDDEARTLAGFLGEDVRAEELTKLGIGEAMARIGTHVARIKIPPPRPIPVDSPRDKIVALSHKRYYKTREEVLDSIERRKAVLFGVSRRGFVPEGGTEGEETYEYDQL